MYFDKSHSFSKFQKKITQFVYFDIIHSVEEFREILIKKHSMDKFWLEDTQLMSFDQKATEIDEFISYSVYEFHIKVTQSTIEKQLDC